jgi:hypothetical protein
VAQPLLDRLQLLFRQCHPLVRLVALLATAAFLAIGGRSGGTFLRFICVQHVRRRSRVLLIAVGSRLGSIVRAFAFSTASCHTGLLCV